MCQCQFDLTFYIEVKCLILFNSQVFRSTVFDLYKSIVMASNGVLLDFCGILGDASI